MQYFYQFSNVFILIFILLFIIFSISKSKSFGLFDILVLYCLFAIIDTFIPSVLWSFYGFESKPYFLKEISPDQQMTGIVFYTLYYLLMFISIKSIIPISKKKWISSFNFTPNNLEKIILRFFIITCIIFTLSLLYEINQFGGFTHWIFNKFTIRFDPSVRERTFIEMFYRNIPWRELCNTNIYLLFLFRFKFNKPHLYGFIYPFLGVLFALTTSYRGTILLFLIGLFSIEYIRIYIHKKLDYKSNLGIGAESIIKVKYLIFGAFVIFSFIAYGTIRSNYVDQVTGQYYQNNSSPIYKVLSQGSGIQGISSIMRRYGHDLDYLYGKTYIDMLLLPIPRQIYTSKPEWYGIDDITRNMGWPKFTQSAVTMPGEAYANFGWFGLIIAIVSGMFLGFLIKYILSNKSYFIVLYSSVVIPIIVSTIWMSFTGLMNRFFPTIFILVMIYLISYFSNKGKNNVWN